MNVNVLRTAIGIVILFTVLSKKTLSHALSGEILFINETSQDSFEFINSNDKRYVIKNEGCSIPYVNSSHDSVWEVYKYSVKPKPCSTNLHPLIKNNKTHIWIINRNLRYYRAERNSNFKCCYKILKRHPITQIRNQSSGLHDCFYFKDSIPIKDEFIKITCSYNSQFIYEQMFVFAVKKKFTQHRLNPFTSQSNHSAYNVVILGLSSISRFNFHRTMIYTSTLAKEKGAIELLGYNKIADNTFRNVIPAIVGMNTEELNRTCWPNAQMTLDNCPYIWERFKDSGYYTILAEDTRQFGIFKTNQFGFSGNPTDYYLRPFTKKINLKRNIPQSVCMGHEFYYRIALNYIYDLISILSPSKLFALFWESSISRKQLHFPNLLDRDYYFFLQNLTNNGYLNETFVFMLSDHGIKNGDIQLTKRSKLEERLPVASILVPPSFSERYPLAYENLKTNSRRLSTAYDVHETLIDLINLSALSNEELIDRTRTHFTKNKGISLFLPIPRNRTCQSAGIKQQWCACTGSNETYNSRSKP